MVVRNEASTAPNSGLQSLLHIVRISGVVLARSLLSTAFSWPPPQNALQPPREAGDSPHQGNGRRVRVYV